MLMRFKKFLVSTSRRNKKLIVITTDFFSSCAAALLALLISDMLFSLGIIENLIRSVPKNLTAQVDFSKIRITKIFKWLKNENISEIEMLKTFNCGVGFCLLVNEKNVSKVVKIFPNKFKPYKIGQIIKGNKKFKIINKLKW